MNSTNKDFKYIGRGDNMSRRPGQRGTVLEANPLSNFTIRILSLGHVELEANQWRVPRSNSLFWSLYIPEDSGLKLGYGKSAIQVPANYICLVPPGANAARDNQMEIRSLFFHFDIGGFTGIQLGEYFGKMVHAPVQKFQSQRAEIEEAICGDNDLRLQLCAQELLSGVLAHCVSRNANKKAQRSAQDITVKQILPAIYAVEERLNSARCQSLKVSEMADLCDLKPVEFSRRFFEATGKNPAKYYQDRKIAVAAQHVLFSNKSIDEITEDFTFSNRFYFSRVFKEEVGVTPAAYRAAFRVQQ